MGNIILIGFMGCGKTSVGKKVAEKLNYCFCDVDRMIERDNKMSISEIFQEYGEEHFRAIETKAIMNLRETVRNCIISVGGGLPLRDENRIFLKELGKVVFINVSKEVIIKRLEHDVTRPILNKGNKEDIISRLMAEREPIYTEVSDIVVHVGNKEFIQVVDEICDYVKS